MRFIVLLLAFACTLWISVAVAAEPTELDLEMRDLLETINALEADYYAEHGVYGNFDELELPELDAVVDSTSIAFLDCRGIALWLDDNGEHYLLIAVGDTWLFTSMEDQSITDGSLSVLDEELTTTMDRISDAQSVYVEKHEEFTLLAELCAADLLPDSYYPLNDVFDTEVAMPVPGLLISMDLDDFGGYSAGGFSDWRQVFCGESGDLASLQLIGKECAALANGAIRERARNSLRTVVSAEAAWYASHGRYGMFPEMAAERYLDQSFRKTPATLGHGIVVEVTVAEDGQSYDAIALIDGVPAFSASENGVIEEVPHDEAAIKEYARKDIATVISAEAAWWVTHGSYGMFPEMIAERFLAEPFINEAPAILNHGIVIEVAVAEDGQSYDATALIDGVPAFSADETGQIVEIATAGEGDSE